MVRNALHCQGLTQMLTNIHRDLIGQIGLKRFPEPTGVPAGFLDNHRLTIAQNGTAIAGDMYHIPRYSVSIGPRDILNARDYLEWHDLGHLGGYSSWERIISRLHLFGSVCKEVPASLFQLTKGTIYISEDMARAIETMDLVAF